MYNIHIMHIHNMNFLHLLILIAQSETILLCTLDLVILLVFEKLSLNLMNHVRKVVD